MPAKKETFTAASLARELDMSPKRARAVLRAAGMDKGGTRWTFPIAKKTEMKKMLKEAMKPKRAAKGKAPVGRKTPSRRKGGDEAHVSLH